MSIRLRLSFIIVALFLSAISNSFLTHWLGQVGEEKMKWVNHTHEVLYATERFLSAMKDAETGQRGYLLTEDLSYLEPYYSGLKLAKEEMSNLNSITTNKPEQKELLIKINNQMQYKFEELSETISLVQNGEKEKALELVMINKGKEYMDTIRGYFSTFTNNEMILLERRKGDLKEYKAVLTTLVFVEIVFFIGLYLATFWFLNKNLFLPLKLLVKTAEKVEKGKKLEASDIVDKDEVGILLSAFYNMAEKVYERERSLDHKAKHDSLTGLKNRETVLQDIEESIAKSQKSKTKIAILFIDLNSFKQVNDTLGHDFGDFILKEAALRFSLSVRSSDTIFRLGGDEFLIIIKNIENISHVFGVIKKIQNEFSVPMVFKGKSIDISISIGVSISPDDSVNSDELIEYSDIAMYASKKDKGNSYQLFDRSMLKRVGDKAVIRKDENP